MPADTGDGGGGGGGDRHPWPSGPPGPFNSSWPADANSAWWKNHYKSYSASSSAPASALETGGGANNVADKDHPTRLGHGGLMAAVIVPPLVVVFAIVGLVFFLARRRRSRRYYSSSSEPKPPLSSMEMASSPTSSYSNVHINETREYRRPPSPPPQLPPNLNDLTPAPIIISTGRNNAYLTGLDTSSQGSQSRPVSGDFDDNMIRRSFGGTFADPPPPYVPKGQGDDPPPAAYEYEVSPLEESSGGVDAFERARSPFADHYAYVDEEDIGMADGMQYRSNPFDDPESPVSETGNRIREGVRSSDVREL